MIDPVITGLSIATGGSMLLATCMGITSSRVRRIADKDRDRGIHYRDATIALSEENIRLTERLRQWRLAAADLSAEQAELVRDLGTKEFEILALRARCEAAEDRVHARNQPRNDRGKFVSLKETH